jgi:uncharacterized cupin superfamily protein
MGTQHPNVTNIDELDWTAMEYGSQFASRSKRLGAAASGKRLGCTLYEVAPGKRAFPLHAHLANEEAIYVLDGQGLMRIGDGEKVVRSGHYIALPIGQAHQLINTSSAPLRYLCFSTMVTPEVALYPDSDKLGILSGEPAPMRAVFKRSGAGTTMADYFEGEGND